jgi:hypothetical protein
MGPASSTGAWVSRHGALGIYPCDAGESELVVVVELSVRKAAPITMLDHMQSQTESHDTR